MNPPASLRRAALLGVLAVALAGCFQMSSVLTVRPDGSATLRDAVTLSGMGLMALASEAEDGDPWASLDLEARAEALGEGVRLASFEPREDGFEAVYEVDDVRRLQYTLQEGMGSTDAEGVAAFSFLFDEATAGIPATLRVLVPKPEPGKPAPAIEAEETPDAAAPEEAQMLTMMRTFFEDARLTIAVEVEGEITETTGAFVEGSRVTLFDLPFASFIETMTETPEWMGGGFSDPSAIYDAMAGIEGVQIERPGTVRVRFQ